MKKHLTVKEAADELTLSEQTIRRYLKKGTIRGFCTPSASKFGGRWRIPREEIRRFEEVYGQGEHRRENARIDGLTIRDRAPECVEESGVEIVSGEALGDAQLDS